MPNPPRKPLQVLGRKLVMLRTAKGWSQKELARRAAITPATLRAAERGTKATQADSLRRIAKQLNISVDRLTEAEAVDSRARNLNDEDYELAQWFHHAPSAIKNRILALRDRPELLALLSDQEFGQIVDGWPELTPAQRTYVLTTYSFIRTNPMSSAVDADAATRPKARTSHA